MAEPNRVKMTTEELVIELLATGKRVSGGTAEAERLLAELKARNVRDAADSIDAGKVVYDSKAFEAAARNGSMAAVAYVQHVIADHLRAAGGGS